MSAATPLRRLLGATLLLATLGGPVPASAAEPPDVAATEGTWRVPLAERSRSGPGTVALPGTVRFRFDGQTVTLYLVTMKAWMWRTRDDHYRLSTRWVGDVLEYRPPFGRWTPLATFVRARGRFEQTDAGGTWVYERVTSATKDDQDRYLDWPRQLHDYTIKPTDRRSDRRP